MEGHRIMTSVTRVSEKNRRAVSQQSFRAGAFLEKCLLHWSSSQSYTPVLMGPRLVRLMTMKLVRLTKRNERVHASPRVPLQVVALARTSLYESGIIRSANQPPRPVSLISTLISVVRWPCYNYFLHRPVRLKRSLSGNGSKRSIPREVDVGRLPVLQSPRSTRPTCRPLLISNGWSLPQV